MAIEKQVKVNLIAQDELSPKIAEIAKQMETKLIKVSEQTAKAFLKTEQASKKMQSGLSDTQKVVAGLSSDNEKLSESFHSLQSVSNGFFEGLGNHLAGIAKATLVFTGAWAGVKVIDKMFPTLEEGIFKVGQATLKASYYADKAFSEFAAGEGVIRKVQEVFFQLSSRGLTAVSQGLNILKTSMSNIRLNLQATQLMAQNVAKATLGTGKAFVAAAKHTELFEKGLAGAVTRAGIGASAFSALGAALLGSDSIMKKMAGITLIALALALGGLVAIANQVLHAVGNLAIAIGDKLTAASEKQIEVFSEAEKTTFAFNHTIAAYSKSTEEAAIATDSWTSFQQELTAATGTTAATMRALIAETISATKSMGLSTDQQKELIRSTLDLSERAHKPAIDTLTAMINAMNGAGQGVIALGLHVNDAAIQHSKLSQAQKENFKTADDATQAQNRFAVLMEQAGKAAGFATANADLYSKSVKLQKNAIETLNAELGRGAAIINGEYMMGLARATNAITQFFRPILPGVGFLQALGGRLLQVTGFFVKHALTLALVTSSYKALNILMARGFAGGVFGKEIPFLNKSIGRMAKELGATSLKLDSLKAVGVASLQILKTQTLNGVKALIGLESTAALTARTVGTQLVKGLSAMAAGIWGAVKAAAAFVMTPIGATITAIVAGTILLYNAFKALEAQTGIFSAVWNDLKESLAETSPILQIITESLKAIGIVLVRGFGVAVKLTAAALAQMVRGAFEVILAFQKLSQFLPGSMGASDAAIAKTEARIQSLNNASQKLAGEGFKDLMNIFMSNATATEIHNDKLAAYLKKLEEVEIGLSKFSEKAKKAYEFASEFTPKINLAKFQKEALDFERTLIEMQGYLEEKKITLLSAPEQTEEVKKALSDVQKEIEQSEEAIKGIRLRNAAEIRDTKIQIAQMEIDEQINRVWTAEQQIKQMKIDAAQETRDNLVQIETNRLLQQRGLLSAEAQAGITIKQEAALAANNVELQAFQAKLEAEKQLALSAEQQKQMEVAALRASLLQGTGGEAGAQQDVEVLQEQQKIAQLNTLRQMNLLSEQQFQTDLANIRHAGAQRRLELEMQSEQNRIAALGLSPEALQAKLDLQSQRDQMEIENLRMKLMTKQLTEEEFNIAMQQHEFQAEANRAQIKQQFLQQEIQRDKMRGDSFKASLKEIELAQQQHGMVMGTIRGIQASQEYGAMMGALGNLSSLRNSESKKEFEIGKKAAMAQTIISTFLSATLAYTALAGIPIVGPALGVAAAAAAVAAGMMNLRMIKKQKFQGGGDTAAGAAPAAPTPSETLGGQAHEGMDAVPKSMHNKSFLVAGGERIIQPEANKDLTAYLKEQREGGMQSNTYNISINATADSNIEAIKKAVIEGIRRASERGEPIINAKGVVNG